MTFPKITEISHIYTKKKKKFQNFQGKKNPPVMTHEALSKITNFVCGSFPLELGFRNRGSRKIGSLFFNAPHMSMGDPQNCC